MAEMRFYQGFWPDLTSHRITAAGQDQKNDSNWRIMVIQNSRLPIIMTLSVRLSPHLRQQLDSYCKTRRVSKTRLIHDLLTDHLSSATAGGKTAYELAHEYGVIGSFSSGKGDLAENRKQYLAEKLRAKHSR